MLKNQPLIRIVKKYTKKTETGDVHLKDGRFDLEVLKKKVIRTTLTYAFVKYFDLNFTHIKTKISIWHNDQDTQEIIFNKNENKLETYCSCSKDLPFCEHRFLVFKDLAHKFGDDFFKDDFLNRYLEKEQIGRASCRERV